MKEAVKQYHVWKENSHAETVVSALHETTDATVRQTVATEVTRKTVIVRWVILNVRPIFQCSVFQTTAVAIVYQIVPTNRTNQIAMKKSYVQRVKELAKITQAVI